MLNKTNEYLTLKELPNGNLKISITPQGKKEYERIHNTNEYPDMAFYELSEDIRCNSNINFFDDCSILGNLSEAPAITDGISCPDTGDWEDVEWEEGDKIWFFDRYMVVSFMEELIENGEVVFQKA